jgi:hypothetical protein
LAADRRATEYLATSTMNTPPAIRPCILACTWSTSGITISYACFPFYIACQERTRTRREPGTSFLHRTSALPFGLSRQLNATLFRLKTENSASRLFQSSGTFYNQRVDTVTGSMETSSDPQRHSMRSSNSNNSGGAIGCFSIMLIEPRSSYTIRLSQCS